MPATNSNKGALLEPDFIARLERLEIVSRKIFHGKMRGERRSKRRGESVEFADYRNYVIGDDLRFLDWNIYARLERLFVKLFLEEEDLHVNLLVDISGSMDIGKPLKSRYAMQIAAALAYIGLSNNDRVSVYAFADGLNYELSGLRGKRMIAKVFDFLGNVECGGVSNLSRACKQYAMRHAQAGILLVLSDFFDKGGYESGLRMLLGRKFDIYCIQVLAPEEIDPQLTGELRLTDVEDDDIAEVSISRALINRYKHNLQAYCAELQSFCTRRGMTYALANTQVPFDQIVMGYLRRRGLLK
ncbi:MAG: DUF58 domain-containing protein [Phycisphaerales bacterium]|nr:DUF58 domain-containing protein [Phycisphaerales bacterium]